MKNAVHVSPFEGTNTSVPSRVPITYCPDLETLWVYLALCDKGEHEPQPNTTTLVTLEGEIE